jgi:hypothetical protein
MAKRMFFALHCAYGVGVINNGCQKDAVEVFDTKKERDAVISANPDNVCKISSKEAKSRIKSTGDFLRGGKEIWAFFAD